MVPMVGTARRSRRDRRACTRYPPTGRRGAAFGFAHDDYQGGDVAAKIAAIHARTMVIAQIETAEGLANVEAIAAVPGVDALWLGHFDLTNFMGIPGAFRHPDVPRRGATASSPRATRHGKAAAFLATDDDWARDYAANGFRLIAYGIDQRCCRTRCGRASTCCANAATSEQMYTMSAKFRVGITRDILDSRGEPAFGRAALQMLEAAPDLEWEYLPAIVPEITPTTPRATTRSTSTWRASRPPRSRAPIAACASSRATAWATTPSTCRR